MWALMKDFFIHLIQNQVMGKKDARAKDVLRHQEGGGLRIRAYLCHQ